MPEHRDDGKERIANEQDSTTSVVEQVVESEHIAYFGFHSLLSSHDPPVMGTYGRLLLGVVPVCAVKRRVVGEGKKTTLLGFQGEFIFSVWVDITSWY